MYQPGEYVVYGVHGVCQITGIEKMPPSSGEYLVLEPTQGTQSRFYIPRGNSAAMGKLRPVMQRQQLLDCLENPRRDAWIQEEPLRKKRYAELLHSRDPEALMAMIGCVRQQRKQLRKDGKRIHICDEDFLRDAQKMVVSEIAFILSLNNQEAEKLLTERE